MQSNCKRRDYQQSNSFQQVIFGLPSYIMINALWAWIVIILPRKYSTKNILPGTHSQERDKIIMKVVQLSNSQSKSKEKRTWLRQCYPHSRPGVFASFALYPENKLSMSQLWIVKLLSINLEMRLFLCLNKRFWDEELVSQFD